MNKLLEKNYKKHCKIALLSYLSKIDCKNAKNQQIFGFVCGRRRKKAILKLLLRELKTQKLDQILYADMINSLDCFENPLQQTSKVH